jgi:hypothetical protein
MFTGTEGEEISLETASAWTANFRSEHPYSIKALYYGRNILLDMLDQENCVGLRFYFAIDSEGAKQLVIVGVDADGNDLYNGIVADRGKPCPTYCDDGSSPLLVGMR